MSVNSSATSFYAKCQNSDSSIVTYAIYTAVTILFLPVYVLVFYMGIQRWRRQRSVSAGTTTGHVNIFTYHLVVVETLAVVGSVLYNLGYVYGQAVVIWGVCMYSIIFPGQTLFHCFTCVEYYLAVAHPITYRQRESVLVTIRHISVGSVWLVCFGWIWTVKLTFPDLPATASYWLFGTSAVVILFCCFSVLHALTHPGPGEVSGNKGRVDQSKWRAFHIISTITGVLLLKFVTLLLCYGLYGTSSISTEVQCHLFDVGIWMTLPSSLVLPLLFLQRERNLTWCWQSAGSR